MPHQVPPPSPPAIIQTVQPQTAPNSVESLVNQGLSIPTPPETFAPEASSGRITTTAAALGQPMSISYPTQANSYPVVFSSASQKVDKDISPKPEQEAQVKGSGDEEKLQNPENSAPITEAAQKLENTETPQQNASPSVEDTETPIGGEAQTQPNSETPRQNTPENSSPAPVPVQLEPNNTNQQESQPSQTTPPADNTPVRERILELNSDSQIFDEFRNIVTAEGNVLLRFDGGVLDADRLQVNLDNLIAVGEGNVAFTRGDQVLRGSRFTYNFVQDTGDLAAGSGEVFIPTAGTDFSFGLPTDVTAGGVPPRPLSDRVRQNQPQQGVGSPGGINIVFGGTRAVGGVSVPQGGGEVRRIRFEAENVDFFPRGWEARNVRITNDPFSPPELELRADKVTYTRETPLRDRIKTEGQRLVFDQGLSLPIPKDEQVIDRTERQVTPGLFSVGYDGDQRGGVFIERRFTPVDSDRVRFSVTPQFFAQKAIQSGGDFPALFGLQSSLNATLGPRTIVEGRARLTSLNLSDIENNLRSSLRLRQTIGETLPHTLTLEASYRNRLYNGTLGFQTVQSSIGGVIQSSVIPLGNTGVNLSYQAGAQYINADTDRLDLLDSVRDNARISLGRFQASAALNRGFLLWQGKPLPTTPTEALRYSPNPVVPYLATFVGVTGTTSQYTNGDNQSTLTGTVGLQGQIGRFSRPFLDYTNFNISYSQSLNNGLSPFLFDRLVDTRVLSAGITQQIYGPFRFGFQTSINLDTGERSSTDYFLEYSRRTYGLTLRYNPVLELGSISFRISDFNWTGGTNPFSEVGSVRGGVQGESNE